MIFKPRKRLSEFDRQFLPKKVFRNKNNNQSSIALPRKIIKRMEADQDLELQLIIRRRKK